MVVYIYVMKTKPKQIKISLQEQTFAGFKAIPECGNAYYFCMLVRRSFLIPEELVVINKLGFEIIKVQKG